MKERLEEISKMTKEKVEQITTSQELKELKAKVLGKKSELTEILRGMGQIAAEQRPVVGELVNKVRTEIEEVIDSKEKEFEEAELKRKVEAEKIDITLPATRIKRGSIHPLNRIIEDVEDLFVSMGYDVVTGPELETDEYCFEKSEYDELMDGLIGAGVVILDDQVVEISMGDAKFRLVGLDDKSLADGTLEALLSDEKELTVVLAHEPQYLVRYADTGVDLVLSGHAHGGQFRLPFVGGIVAPDQGFLPEYTAGEYYMDGTEMIVSRGLGNSVIPVRLFNFPEIVCVELVGKH